MAEIEEKYRDLEEYANRIDRDYLKKNFSRAELKELVDKLNTVRVYSLTSDIIDLIRQKRLEEYPQLLDVHNFPILNEIDFITKEEKIELDKYLVKLRVGNYCSGLWRAIKHRTKQEQVEKWLCDHGILEKKYFLMCPACWEGHMTKALSVDEKESVIHAFEQYKNESEDYSEYMKTINDVVHFDCMECEEYSEIEDFFNHSLKWNEVLVMKSERDKRLDNV
jgi:hypothetical protein